MITADSNLIAVGRINGTHGIRGQLRFHSYSGNLESLATTEEVVLAGNDGSQKTVRIKRAVQHSGKILLTLEGYDSINETSHLIGTELLLQREQLPEPAADEYYWQDLIGLSVVTDNGELLGTLTDIMETGANDVYLVHNRQTGREYLLPAIASVISNVDLQARHMIITPLEGLLDL